MKRQEDDCRLLAASLGWKVVEVYVDNDVTAADRRKKRKDYLRMLEDVKSGHIDAIVSWHPDRLYHQPAELEDLIIIVEEHKTEIATVKAGDLDLSTPTGRLVARMLGAIARRGVEHKQERILRKVQELVATGKTEALRQRRFDSLQERRGPRSQAYAEFVTAGQELVDSFYGQADEFHAQFDALYTNIRKRRSTVAVAGPEAVVQAAAELANEVRMLRNNLMHARVGHFFNEKGKIEKRLDAFTKAARTALEDEGHQT